MYIAMSAQVGNIWFNLWYPRTQRRKSNTKRRSPARKTPTDPCLGKTPGYVRYSAAMTRRMRRPNTSRPWVRWCHGDPIPAEDLLPEARERRRALNAAARAFPGKRAPGVLIAGAQRNRRSPKWAVGEEMRLTWKGQEPKAGAVYGSS